MVKQGKCRRCRRAIYRERYESDPAFRQKRRDYAHLRSRGVPSVPESAREYVMDLTDGRCVYCGAPANTFDHIIPVSRGGKTRRGNIVPACRSCNSSKKDRDVYEWIAGRTLYAPDVLADVILLADAGLYG